MVWRKPIESRSCLTTPAGRLLRGRGRPDSCRARVDGVAHRSQRLDVDSWIARETHHRHPGIRRRAAAPHSVRRTSRRHRIRSRTAPGRRVLPVLPSATAVAAQPPRARGGARRPNGGPWPFETTYVIIPSWPTNTRSSSCILRRNGSASVASNAKPIQKISPTSLSAWCLGLEERLPARRLLEQEVTDATVFAVLCSRARRGGLGFC